MRWGALLASVLLICSAAKAEDIHLVSEKAKIDIKTNKVAHLYGYIDERLLTIPTFLNEMEATRDVPGDRIIFIDSNGGSVPDGMKALRAIDEEKARGVRVICVATRHASSMAFNTLTHCSVRMATMHTEILVHPIRHLLGFNDRLTPRMLRRLYEEVESLEAPFREANAKAMGLPIDIYENYAEAETYWTPQKLLEMGYLKAIVKGAK